METLRASQKTRGAGVGSTGPLFISTDKGQHMFRSRKLRGFVVGYIGGFIGALIGLSIFFQ